jgi:hypothetical protein
MSTLAQWCYRRRFVVLGAWILASSDSASRHSPQAPRSRRPPSCPTASPPRRMPCSPRQASAATRRSPAWPAGWRPPSRTARSRSAGRRRPPRRSTGCTTPCTTPRRRPAAWSPARGRPRGAHARRAQVTRDRSIVFACLRLRHPLRRLLPHGRSCPRLSSSTLTAPTSPPLCSSRRTGLRSPTSCSATALPGRCMCGRRWRVR